MIDKDQVQKICASFLMAIGAGSAGAFYTAMSGFYVEKFQDRSFVILMLLFFCTPFPVISLLQQSFDDVFDEQFSTSVTYAFRVIGLQLVVACIVLLWMALPQTEWNVLGIGLALGTVCSSVISSSIQMTSAIDPAYIINAKLGLQIGGMTPILVFTGMGFKPSSSLFEFQTALSSIVIVCLLSTSVLSYFHLTTSLFTKAYTRLAYDLPSAREDPGEDPGETSSLVAGDRTVSQRQQTETVALGSASAEDDVPSWIKYWQGCHGLVMCLAFYMSSLAGFFGNSAMTQHLTLLKLGMDLVGRFLSTSIPHIPCFTEGPWHKALAVCIVIEVSLSSICFSRLMGAEVSEGVLMLSWCGIFVVSIFSNSLIDVTSASYSQVRERKGIARTNQMVIMLGTLLGLAISLSASGHMERHVPAKG